MSGQDIGTLLIVLCVLLAGVYIFMFWTPPEMRIKCHICGKQITDDFIVVAWRGDNPIYYHSDCYKTTDEYSEMLEKSKKDLEPNS